MEPQYTPAVKSFIRLLLPHLITKDLPHLLFKFTGVPEEEARVYEERFRQGAILVTVKTGANRYNEAVNLLRQEGAEDIQFGSAATTGATGTTAAAGYTQAATHTQGSTATRGEVAAG